MDKEFTEAELDRLIAEFPLSNLNLPQFAQRHRVPYRLLKNHLKRQGFTDVFNGNPQGERVHLVEEFYQSKESVSSFAARKGWGKHTLERWIAADETSQKKRYPARWEKLTTEFHESDFLTMSEFARSRGISPDRFTYWLNRFDPDKTWKRHGESVKEFSQSKLSAPAFAKSKGIKEITFGSWLRRFDPERTLPNRKPYRILNREEQAKLIAEFTNSGQLAKDFAAEHDINPRTFSTWVANSRKLPPSKP